MLIYYDFELLQRLYIPYDFIDFKIVSNENIKKIDFVFHFFHK